MKVWAWRGLIWGWQQLLMKGKGTLQLMWQKGVRPAGHTAEAEIQSGKGRSWPGASVVLTVVRSVCSAEFWQWFHCSFPAWYIPLKLLVLVLNSARISKVWKSLQSSASTKVNHFPLSEDFCSSYCNLLGDYQSLSMRLQSCSTSESKSEMFLLGIAEPYSFLVSIPQEKSDKVSQNVCQNFCSCYPFGPETLAKIQGVQTVPKGRNWYRNQYFSQTTLYIYKEWLDLLFS